MERNNISVKVAGNPASSGGFNTIASVNYPQFIFKDGTYEGVSTNSHFFTVKITEKYVVYMLEKNQNKVYSYKTNRPSTLKIAFSIPKGYHLTNGYTPYDVLVALLKEFLNKCMTYKSSTDTYEYASAYVDQHILDELASKFTIVPCETVWRAMDSQGPIGYYNGDDHTIKQILEDVQYPEFQKYSEIVLANNITNCSYSHIENLDIPRKIVYSLYVDSHFEKTISNEKELITISSRKDPICYINKTLAFTIEEALAGKVSEHVNINKATETIRVSTQGLAEEKVTTIRIVVVPKDYQQFFVGKNLFLLIGQNGMINIDSNLCFTLRGTENSQDFKNRLKLELKTNEYVLKGYTLQGNEMCVTIEPQMRRKEQTPTKSKAGQHKYPATVPTSEDNIKLSVVDLAIRLSNCVQSTELMKVSLRETNKRNIIASTTARFNRTNKTGEKEAHFYIDKHLINSASYILFKLNNTTYTANIGNNVRRNGIEDFILLKDDDFEKEKITFFKTYNKLLIAAILFSAIILIICATLVINHHSDIPNPEPTPISTDPEIETNDDQIKNSLDTINKKLTAKDLSFEDIANIYNQYAQDSTHFNRVDKEVLEGKTAGRINDYYNVVVAITNGDINIIESYLNRGNNLHIYPQHRNCLNLICKAYFPNKKMKNYSSAQKKEAESYFRNNYSRFKKFDDLKEIEKAITPSDSSTDQQRETKEAKQSNKKVETKNKNINEQKVVKPNEKIER